MTVDQIHIELSVNNLIIINLDSFGHLMHSPFFPVIDLSFETSIKILYFPFILGKKKRHTYIITVCFYFPLWCYWQFLRERARFFTTTVFWKMWINTISKEPEKYVRCFISNLWFHLTDRRPVWSLFSFFCFIRFKNKKILCCDSWLPGFYSIKTTNWLCTNYDSEHFPEGVETQIWSNMVWQLAAIPFLLLTSVLKMVCAMTCFIWGKTLGKFGENVS